MVARLRLHQASRWRNVLNRVVLMGVLMWTVLTPPLLTAGGGAPRSRGDRILVKPKAGIPPGQLRSLEARLGCRVLRELPRIAGWQVVQIPRLASVQDMLTTFQASGLVAAVEPDYIVHLAAVPGNVPNDPNFLNGNQWDLYNFGQQGITPGIDIDATNGWAIQNSATNIIIAVIDTGIRYTHEDLAPNLWQNPQVNQDGYSNDLYGINLVANGRGNGDPWDDYGHGSHVSGIIGAKANNGVGIAGICWNAKLMALKFIDTNGDGAMSDAVTCIEYAASHGAKVVNASWGAYWFSSQALWDAVNMLRDHEIIFVAAAGNSTNSNDGPLAVFPATYTRSLDNVIAVAATDLNDQLASFSNYGRNSVQLAAPGDPVFSCWNGSDHDYQWDYGTSMAAPHVTATCALVWSRYPNLTALQVIRQVLNGVDVLTNLEDACTTSGRVNLHKALMQPGIVSVPPNTVWVDDTLPEDAQASPPHTNYFNDGSIRSVDEPWVWVNGNPTPFSGSAAHQSPAREGIHSQSFTNASSTMEVHPGDTLYAYVYLDPENPPNEIMLQWSDNCLEHRAFWGQDIIPYGVPNTSGRVNMGPLPPTGQWVRLAVPAGALRLEGAKVNGMSFVLNNGAATWDYAGRSGVPSSGDSMPPIVFLSAPPNNKTITGTLILAADASDDQSGVASVQFQLDGANLGAAETAEPYRFTWDSTETTDGPHTLGAVAIDGAGNVGYSALVNVVVSNSTQQGVNVIWMDDSVPAGATTSENAGDSWTWTNNNPTPISGTMAHESCVTAGLHYHYFYDATDSLTINPGDVLFTYIYLDPANMPSQVMLEWCDGNSWSHTAYWGANLIASGVDGTASQYFVGPLPPAGQWVRLEVPASAVRLEGTVVTGMYFTLYDGRATWDFTGRRSASQ